MPRPEHSLQLCQEFREVGGKRVPQNLVVHVVVSVDQPVSHVDDLGPGDFRVLVSGFGWKLAGGFAHEFHEMGHGQAQHLIVFEVSLGLALRESHGLAGELAHV